MTLLTIALCLLFIPATSKSNSVFLVETDILEGEEVDASVVVEGVIVLVNGWETTDEVGVKGVCLLLTFFSNAVVFLSHRSLNDSGAT